VKKKDKSKEEQLSVKALNCLTWTEVTDIMMIIDFILALL
jgi:hypothetical protein